MAPSFIIAQRTRRRLVPSGCLTVAAGAAMAPAMAQAQTTRASPDTVTRPTLPPSPGRDAPTIALPSLRSLSNMPAASSPYPRSIATAASA